VLNMVRIVPTAECSNRLEYRGASCVVTETEGDFKFSSVEGIQGYLNPCWTVEEAAKEFKKNVDRELGA